MLAALYGSTLPLSYWTSAFTRAEQALLFQPLTTKDHKTTFEMIYKRVPILEEDAYYLKTFGAPTFTKAETLNTSKKNKLRPKAEAGYYLHGGREITKSKTVNVVNATIRGAVTLVINGKKYNRAINTHVVLMSTM